MKVFGQWGATLLDHPWREFYAQQPTADHLPGDLYVHGALAWCSDTLLHVHPASADYARVLKVASCLLDAALASCVWLFVRRHGGDGVRGALLVLACPAFVLVSGRWGQWDNLSAAIALLAGLCVARRSLGWVLLGGALTGWALLVKPQLALGALAVGLLVAWHAARQRDGRTLGLLAACTGAALASVEALSLPFDLGLAGSRWGILDRMALAAEMYHGTALGASNLWSGLWPGWHDDTTVSFLLTPRGWGHVGLVLLLGVVLARALNAAGERLVVATWAATMALAAFYLAETRCHERYLFPAVVGVVVLWALSDRGRAATWCTAGIVVAFSVTIWAAIRFGITGAIVPTLYLLASWTNIVTCAALLWFGPRIFQRAGTAPAPRPETLG